MDSLYHLHENATDKQNQNVEDAWELYWEYNIQLSKKICTFRPIGVKNESWFCPFAFFNYLIVIDQWEKGSTVIYINVCAKDGNDAFAHVSIMINDDVTDSHWLLLFWAVFTDDHHCAGTDGDAKPLPRYTDLDYLSVNIVGKDFAE